MDFQFSMLCAFAVLLLGMWALALLKFLRIYRQVKAAVRGDRLLDVAEMATKVIVAPLITLFGTVIPVGLLVWVRVLGKPAPEW